MISLRSTPLSVDELLETVADTHAGGHAVFIGTVRDHDEGHQVEALAYTAHPHASAVLWDVARRVAGAHDVIAVAAVHRVGELSVGDTAVVVAVSAAHRGQALAACRQLIDDLKAEVPIWKQQRFVGGATAWVGTDTIDPGSAPTLVP